MHCLELPESDLGCRGEIRDVEELSAVDESDLRWRRPTAGAGERSQVEGRGAISGAGGEELSQIEGSDRRWRGAIADFTRLARAAARLDSPGCHCVARLHLPFPGRGRPSRALPKPLGAALHVGGEERSQAEGIHHRPALSLLLLERLRRAGPCHESPQSSPALSSFA